MRGWCIACRPTFPAVHDVRFSCLRCLVCAHSLEALSNAGCAQVDLRRNDGCTPMMAAAWMGKAEVVRVLLASGAEVDRVGADARAGCDVALPGVSALM